MKNWYSLPLEIQWTIMECVDDLLQEMTPEMAAMNAPDLVNREWRDYFQHYHFHTLALDQHRLEDFDHLVSQRPHLRDNVRMIRFHIKLRRYRCGDCRKSESELESLENSLVFEGSLEHFMSIMSKWPRRPRGQKHHLTLDLGAYSPSDSLHGFRASQLHRDHIKTDTQDPDDVMSNKCPGWLGYLAGLQPGEGALKRVQSVLDSSSSLPNGFPSAPAIDELLISMRCYRHISTELLSQLVSRGLPSIRHFRHEMSAHPGIQDRTDFREGYQEVIKALPQSLDTFSFFYEYMQPEYGWGPVAVRVELGEVLAQLATRMSVCSVAFLLDAEDFLEASLELSKTQEAYPRLARLTLTSRTLADSWDPHPENVAQLLLLGAKMAFLRMPALKSLDIWNGGRGYNIEESFLVRFSIQGEGQLHVEWSTTGGWAMTDAIDLFKKCWDEREPLRPLHVYYRLGKFNVANEGRNIYWHPALSHVLHPESREQVKREHDRLLLERGKHSLGR